MTETALNAGTPWPPESDRDLRDYARDGRSIEYAAMTLCRTEQEIRERAIELGLRFKDEAGR